MKKIRSIVLAALCSIAALSCSKEKGTDERTPVADAPLQTLEARTVAVKSFLDENINILWNSGDALSVFDGAENKEFTTEDEGAEARFNYYGPLSKDKSFYALYPYDEAASVAGNVISTTIPTTQIAVAGSFAKGANLAVGYATYGRMVYFKNALAYAKVGFKSAAGAKISKIVFRSNDETVLLSGKATLDVTVTDGDVSDIAATVTEGVPYAELVAPDGEFLAADTDYYIAVAPVALTGGYQIEFVDEDGLVLTKTYDGDAYKAAVLKRNNIAPVGKKNIDNIEVEAWYRVHNANLQSANHPGVGNYLVVKKMDDGSYRILDDEGSDTYIVKGTHFELSGSRMVMSEAYKKLTMESIVAYVFRNAQISSADASANIIKANDEVIVSPSDIGIEVKKYTSNRVDYFYANITLYNRKDNRQMTATLDNLTCSLNSSDETTLSGKFNTKTTSTIPDGNPNTCSDLVDALMYNAGDFSGYRSTIISEATNAIKGTDNSFSAGGWSSKVYSKSTITTTVRESLFSSNYITVSPIIGSLNYSNHFMIKTSDLLSGAQTSAITLYKKDSKPYSYYLTIK